MRITKYGLKIILFEKYARYGGFSKIITLHAKTSQ